MQVHFIGIGGVSMSALAKYLSNHGFLVTGSDRFHSFATDELEYLGIKVFIGHKAENLNGCDVVIYSSAIEKDNPELLCAKENKIPCFDRAELLNYLSKRFKFKIGVSGCHGKTSVTSIISHILYAANCSFTAHIGGYDKMFGNLIDNGQRIFLTEICEFGRNINKFTADVAVTLNIDNDHMNCYDDMEDLAETFYSFLDRAKYKIVNIDDKYLKKYRGSKIAYGLKEGDFYIKNLSFQNGAQNFTLMEYGRPIFDISTNLPGKYSVLNLLAAVTVARSLGVNKDAVLKGIASFTGVKRRNEFIGRLKGAKVIADYAHHPSEIKCFLDGLKLEKGRLFVVFQPHTYSRTRLLYKDFIRVLSGIENLYLYKTYAARENFDMEGSSLKLSGNLPKSKYYDNFDSLYEDLRKEVSADDTIIILGAGDLYEKVCSKIS